MERSVTVIAPHKSSYPDPLRLSAGDPVTIEREDDEYPGWVWAVTAEGRCGWVHRDYLRDATAPGSTLCTRPYTSLELDTEVGESLQVLDELDGWYLTMNGSAAVGWVPIATVADAGQ